MSADDGVRHPIINAIEILSVEEPVVELPTPTNFALRINAGGERVAYNGTIFSADIYSDTGTTLDRPQTGLDDPFKSFRYSTSQVLGYDIPLENGTYTVRLHFAELWFGATGGGSGGAGSRIFDVRLNGQIVENNLDVFAEVGAEAALAKTYCKRHRWGAGNRFLLLVR